MVLVQTTLQGTIANVDQLNTKLDLAEVKLRSVNRLCQYLVASFIAMGLPKDIQAQARVLIRAIALLNQFRAAWALTAATTPLGFLYAVPIAMGVGMTAMAGISDLADAIGGNTR